MEVEIHDSSVKGKKYKIVLLYENGRTKTLHIGQKGAEDMTTHNDEQRKQKYLARHKKREKWTKSGIETAGFWSRWLSWNKPTLSASIADIEKRFNINIIKK